MHWGIKILLLLGASAFVFFIWRCCVVASRADRQMQQLENGVEDNESNE